MKTENRNSGHLTENEISQWLVEGPEESALQHVESCSLCESKLAEAQAPLQVFRSAWIDWSQSQTAAPVRLQTRADRHESRLRLGLWLPAAGAAFAALLAVGYTKVPALLQRNSTQQPSAAAAASTVDSDEALLTQVDSEVSEAVPDAMAPLTDLVSWDSSEGYPAPNRDGSAASPKASVKSAIVKTPVDVTD